VRAIDIITKKRDRGELNTEEIEYFIRGYTNGEIPDYQAAAWLMAVLLNGMTERETVDLTLAMAYSGDTIDLAKVVPVAVDKHSTGGVGDKTTLVVGPVVAACGLPVGKMSGRGLGYSGGTLDKLESIPGFRANLTTDEFIEQLRTVGLVVCGQTADLAPADGKMYALRDVTATVQSIPLIASSVMSKKIASGAQVIVLDVKVGQGAFMKNLQDARTLAELMVRIANKAGRKAGAILSDMNQPLGNAVGNALELNEAIQTLRGGGPADFREHCLFLASYMLALSGFTPDQKTGRDMAEKVLDSRKALVRFSAMVAAQGGDVSYIEQPERLPRASLVKKVISPRSGYLKEINAQMIGESVVRLGGGRSQKGDQIEYGVGIIVHSKVGDHIENDQTLFTIHANRDKDLIDAQNELLNACKWSDDPVKPLPLFYGIFNGTGITGISQ
jgi:pyrimidine-nucleoside phosphorylase